MSYTIKGMPPEGELVHYGVKGMKWGVHKTDPDAVSTETRAERKASSRGLGNYIWDSIKDEPIFRSMSRAEYEALSRRGETFVKNSTFQRVTSNSDATIKGAAFVSKLKEDAEFYRASIPAIGPNTKNEGGPGSKIYREAHYEHTYAATKKLSSPSEKVRVDAFLELLSEPSIKIKGKDAPITGRQYLEKKGYKLGYKKYDNFEYGLKTWYNFLNSHGDQDNPLARAYFDKIRSKGYNAMIDDNDAGRFAKKPIILLDPETTTKIKNVRRLTTDDINRAQRELGKR